MRCTFNASTNGTLKGRQQNKNSCAVPWKETNGVWTLINSFLKYQTAISTNYGAGAFRSWKHGVFALLPPPLPAAARIQLRSRMFFFNSTCKNQVHNQLDKAKPSWEEVNIRPRRACCTLARIWPLQRSWKPAQQSVQKELAAFNLAPNEPHQTNKQKKETSQISTERKC